MDLSSMLRVIDVSRWQGSINWTFVSQNVHAAMIKLGGSDDGFYMDGRARRNIIEARSHNLPIGFYYYLGGVHSPEEEAAHITNLVNEIGGLNPGEPFCLDWEERKPGLNEVAYIVAIVERLVSRGFPPPVIYMNEYYLTSNDWRALQQRMCKLWVASWGNNNAYAENWEIPESGVFEDWWLWQYSSTGSVPGISGRVDLNLLRGDLESFQRAGLSKGVSIPGSPKPLPAPQISGYKQYTVVKGDSLSKIAAKYGKSWQELYAMNRDLIAQPNRIFVNQKIRVWDLNPEGSGAQPDPLPTSTHSNPQLRTHTVVNGENLTVIAAKYGLSHWSRVYNLNRDVIGNDPNLIKPGQVLKIP